MFPAVTGSGESVFVTERSADVLTDVLAEDVLLASFGSGVVEPTDARLLMELPLAVLALTFTTSVKTAGGSLTAYDFVAVTPPVPPTAGVVRDHPAGAAIETNVVPVGTPSVNCVTASEGPALSTVIVYVMLLPAVTGSGESVLVTDKLADAFTVVVAVAELLPAAGSNVDEPTEAVLLIVPPAVPVFTTSVKTPDAAAATDGLLQLTAPAAPTAGVVHDQPPGDVRETKVLPGGSVSLSVAF